MAGAALVAVLGAVAWPAFSQIVSTTSPTTVLKYKGAPGPIAGASLPVLAVGFGVYWLIRRRRKPE
jgi:hypothetical protein